MRAGFLNEISKPSVFEDLTADVRVLVVLYHILGGHRSEENPVQIAEECPAKGVPPRGTGRAHLYFDPYAPVAGNHKGLAVCLEMRVGEGAQPQVGRAETQAVFCGELLRKGVEAAAYQCVVLFEYLGKLRGQVYGCD